MSRRPRVLLVAPTPRIAARGFAWLADTGFEVTVVASFQVAKAYLEESPALLISEVRLGEYNGLHLALRARARDIPAVIVGDADPVLEHDARQLGAAFLVATFTRDALLAVVEAMPAAPPVAPGELPDGANIAFVSGLARDTLRVKPDRIWTPGRPVQPS